EAEGESGEQDQEAEGQTGEEEQKPEAESGMKDASGEKSAGAEEEPESEAGSEEKQQDKGDSGMQAVQDDGNVPIDENDEGPGPLEEGDAGGEDETQDRQDSGSVLDLSGGLRDKPDELTGEDAAASQAVDQFDQMETGLGGEDREAAPGGLPDPEGIPGSGIPMIMLEQWLERIEGDPAYLLRNQFMIEERQAMEQYGRTLMENRPW
ncbi:MAG: hypothetical protein OEN52_00720, partial [Gammaproteobacteria bacterium]|nr:hypothetical protein [Gammaproteobacteria bacterium]